jgi:hypothetical protein
MERTDILGSETFAVFSLAFSAIRDVELDVPAEA